MTLAVQTIRKTLNKAFLKVKPNRIDIDLFKANLARVFNSLQETESEEFHKNLISDFLKETYYKQNYFINTKGRNDLVIHNENTAKSTVGVIIEAKSPANKTEMLTVENINVKALHELVLYYLRERITHKNIEIKHLIATNINEWFVFDAVVFERIFAQNKNLIKQFHDFEEGRLPDTRTEFFYKQIAEPIISSVSAEIEFCYFNILDFKKTIINADTTDDTTLIPLFKIFSPEHLLKIPFANDSNSLDKRFYSELLHIMGLTEVKKNGKKIIERKTDDERNNGSLIENTIIQLDSLDKLSRFSNNSSYGETLEERFFNIGIELCITWINRILFLKLLEAQLLAYHKRDKTYAFLCFEKLKDFDDLNNLFFQVLARKYDDRNENVKHKFAQVPYLNSSLFEPTEMEHNTFFISQLQNDISIPVYAQTVLKDSTGKKRSGDINPLEYLFAFLNAYDFSSEGSEEIQEENKTLINASVLGLIFEKINGYKDGSFFTPGFITMYMCHETIQQAVVQKFNDTKKWNCTDVHSLYNKIEDITEANTIINNLKICDPAVGSGHFLVSALNEIIALKSELRILQDRQGQRLKEYHFEVVNDELIVTDENGKLFEYNPNSKESQRIQEALFHEKQTIIENCLFGVDINPNSVKICRLRLWIELLKNAYYIQDSNSVQTLHATSPHRQELQTLPNIDINIKCGNSLVSRYPLNANLKTALKSKKWSIESYRLAISTYRNTNDKSIKREMEQLILNIKQDFTSEIRSNDPLKTKLDRLANELYNRFTGNFLFDPETPYNMSQKEFDRKRKKEQEKLEKEIALLTRKFDELKHNKIYNNAFEWRFEFPEVLNDEGDFVGFDVVIGNPPYIRQEELSLWKDYFKTKYDVYAGTADILVYFFELAANIAKTNGNFSLITSNKFMRANYGINLRNYLNKFQLEKIIDFGELPVFEEAATFPAVFSIRKQQRKKAVSFTQVTSLEFKSLAKVVAQTEKILPEQALMGDFWSFGGKDTNDLLEKMIKAGTPLDQYVNGQIYRGILTGYNHAFILNEEQRTALIEKDPKSAEIIFPYAIGDDIRFYHIRDTKRYIILTKIGVDMNQYPAVFEHLKQFQAELEKRWDKGNYWWELRACAYYDEFLKPKIVFPDIAKESRWAISKNPLYIGNTAYFIPIEDYYLLGVMNSKAVYFYFSKIASVLGDAQKGGRLRWIYQDVKKIPVPDSSKKAELTKLVKEILDIKEQNTKSNIIEIENQINQIVYQLFGLSEEEIKIIESSVG